MYYMIVLNASETFKSFKKNKICYIGIHDLGFDFVPLFRVLYYNIVLSNGKLTVDSLFPKNIVKSIL